MRDEFWVYCAHCSVNNEIQPVEWGASRRVSSSRPTEPGEPCVHHVYKDVTAIPAEAYERIGQTKPLDEPARPAELTDQGTESGVEGDGGRQPGGGSAVIQGRSISRGRPAGRPTRHRASGRSRPGSGRRARAT